MKLSEISAILESWAPLSYQESYDNSGLLVGNYQSDISKALITLDCTEAVVQEAIDHRCNLIIAHHPIVFAPIKRLNGSNYVERTLIKAIQNDIAIYAIHTNLDNVSSGVNHLIADKLNLQNRSILSPKKQLLKKLVVYIPKDHFDTVRQAIFDAGAGHIGNYSHCGFSISGQGSFLGNENASPHIGNKGELANVEEMRLETVFPSYLESKILAAMQAAHPYEEVAYDIFLLENKSLTIGSGLIGELDHPCTLDELLSHLKKEFHLQAIKHTAAHTSKIQKIALCGGSGSFLRQEAIQRGADVFITSDFKYHEWFDHEGRIAFVDIGHYESEQFTPLLISCYLEKNALSLQTQISGINTNPVNIYI